MAKINKNGTSLIRAQPKGPKRVTRKVVLKGEEKDEKEVVSKEPAGLAAKLDTI